MDTVKVWQETVAIPTYEAGEPSSLPMFLEKRVYQGSSGRVYPYQVTEKISDEKTDKEYTAVFLENNYLLVMILPEIGGKIHRILDKTNNYDAVYYNEVIKPALVGLAGPWVSGGIEFNWPQHHRPTTFSPVEFTTRKNDDGSATVIVGETERMYRMKGMAEFTLYPDKAYLEIKGQIYNPTDRPQTFLWWANPAVAVNDFTQSVFPPDVHAVMDHGKRDVSNFPIATGTYYKTDYGEGVDISRYKNIPVPTSYMAYHSDYDFVGNFDYGKDAGILHIADHHISPGKKQWTWGSGDFGKAWDRNLTDENGPYIELMTGVFTDNQPDFTFIAPYEEKTFTQYFIPYKGVGAVKNAVLDAMVNLEIMESKAIVSIYSPYKATAVVSLSGKTEKYLMETVELSPENPYETAVEIDEDDITDLLLSVTDEDGNTIVEYSPLPESDEKAPAPAEAAKKPEDIVSLEELYLTALHLEQYRHATYSPEPYYIEGLKRDPTDIRLNNGYGKYLYRNGYFEESEKYFRAAIKKSMWKNPNPYDCEPYYNLGLSLKRQERLDEAFDAFYKSIWSGAMQDKGFYQLACISAKKNRLDEALDFAEKSLLRGMHNIKARNLKTSLLRLMGRNEEAIAFAYETHTIDPLDFGCMYELYRLSNDFVAFNELTTIMRGDLHNYIELSLNYYEFGLFEEAAKVLAIIAESDRPMLHYYMAFYSNSDIELEKAASGDCSNCFPNTLADIAILNYAIERNPGDANAPYLLGNLYYDKGQWEKAVELWEKAVELREENPRAYRNLALAYFNKLHDADKSLFAMNRAARYAPDDARIAYELDQLNKQTNMPVNKRLVAMAENPDMTASRDDLYTEYITLMNCEKYYDKAYTAAITHIFHPWEGGEGKITAQYKKSLMGLAWECIKNKDYEGAAEKLTAALTYPENLGEGKLAGALDNDIYYLLGKTYAEIDLIQSTEYYKLASRGSGDISSAVYYNDQPPEMMFYQALAYRELGDEKAARSRFNKLIDYARQHIGDHVDIDYFAVSLPDFLIFETDLDKKNFVDCCYMAALGHLGLGNTEKAKKFINDGLEVNVSHQGLIELKHCFSEE